MAKSYSELKTFNCQSISCICIAAKDCGANSTLRMVRCSPARKLPILAPKHPEQLVVTRSSYDFVFLSGNPWCRTLARASLCFLKGIGMSRGESSACPEQKQNFENTIHFAFQFVQLEHKLVRTDLGGRSLHAVRITTEGGSELYRFRRPGTEGGDAEGGVGVAAVVGDLHTDPIRALKALFF